MLTARQFKLSPRRLINVPTTRKLWKYVDESWEHIFDTLAENQDFFWKCANLIVDDVNSCDRLKDNVKFGVVNSLAEVLNGVTGLSMIINKIPASQRWKDYRVSKDKWNNFFSRHRQIVHVMGYPELRITDFQFRRLLIAIATYIRDKYSGTLYGAWYWDYIIFYLTEIGKKVVILSTLTPSNVFKETINGRFVVCTSLGMHTYTEHKVNNVRSLLSRSTCVFVAHKSQDQLVFPIKMLNLVDTGFVTQATLEKTFESEDSEYLEALCKRLSAAYASPSKLRACFVVTDGGHTAHCAILHPTEVVRVN